MTKTLIKLSGGDVKAFEVVVKSGRGATLKTYQAGCSKPCATSVLIQASLTREERVLLAAALLAELQEGA